VLICFFVFSVKKIFVSKFIYWHHSKRMVEPVTLGENVFCCFIWNVLENFHFNCYFLQFCLSK